MPPGGVRGYLKRAGPDRADSDVNPIRIPNDLGASLCVACHDIPTL
jgi:hypothetical protein